MFGHVNALHDVSVGVHYGEIVALYGDNGAGKSTLLKTMLGIVTPDNGEIAIDGVPIKLTSVRDSQVRGVDAVHQDLALAPDLSILDSMFLGHEIMHTGVLGRLGFLDRNEMATQAVASLEKLGITIPSMRLAVKQLSGGQR